MNIANKSLRGLAWVLLAQALSATLAWAGDDDPHRWLDRMSHAFRETDYDGVFVYEQGSSLHSLRIVHAVKDGVEQERLVQLDGEPREIIRKGHDITCIHPGDELVRLDHAVPAGPFGSDFMGTLSAAQAAYQPELGEAVRVAGRDAVTLTLVPQDEYRYAHRMVLDRDTALLLRSEILDAAGRPLERFQFTSLAIGPVPPAALQPSLEGQYQAHHFLQHPGDKAPDGSVAAWDLQWVPPGFLLAMTDVDRDVGDKAGVRMYTDGLAVFSVFVEPANEEAAETVMQQGATVAYARTLRLDNAALVTVTVIGEIPVLTARRLAAAVVPGGASHVQ